MGKSGKSVTSEKCENEKKVNHFAVTRQHGPQPRKTLCYPSWWGIGGGSWWGHRRQDPKLENCTAPVKVASDAALYIARSWQAREVPTLEDFALRAYLK